MIEGQRKCLEGLASTTLSGGEMCVPFNVIEAKTNFPRNIVRRHVRALARKGLAEYYRGLMDDDGMPAGAGYCITEAGLEVMKMFKKDSEKETP